MGLFKKKPIDNFNLDYLHLKVMLYKSFRLLASTDIDIKLARLDIGVTDDKVDKFAAQAVDYLIGERPDVIIGNEGLVEKIYGLPSIRAMLDAIRDWKYEKLDELLGTKWTDTEEAKRLAEIILREDENIKLSEGYVEFMGDLRELRF
jgi:hypothetical protein